MMAEDATPLAEALLAIVGEDAFITRVLEAVDNPKIIVALAAHGHPVAGN
jgi:hypothetical protein